jgi:hypothetical protein
MDNTIFKRLTLKGMYIALGQTNDEICTMHYP